MEHFDKHLYRYLLAAAVVVLGGGTVFYHFIEKWSWVNSWYFCVVTLATVGYGDLVPKTDFGKLFTTLYIIIGVGLVGAFFTSTIRRRGYIMRQKRERNNAENDPKDQA
jgi:hypothetical protein